MMNRDKGKNRFRYLVGAVALMVSLLVVPGCQESTVDSKATKSKSKVIEPKFTKEAEGFLIDLGSGDTLQRLDIEIAERRDEIEYGMMYRKSMAEQTGMLFLLGMERPQSFYMKNTYVPLDIIYLDNNSQVVSIQKNAKPLDETSLPSGKPAAMVLEVQGGFSDKFGVSEGTLFTWQRIK
jgi:uncharacterized membrane protein (UPF0127 family)